MSKLMDGRTDKRMNCVSTWDGVKEARLERIQLTGHLTTQGAVVYWEDSLSSRIRAKVYCSHRVRSKPAQGKARGNLDETRCISHEVLSHVALATQTRHECHLQGSPLEPQQVGAGPGAPLPHT